MLDITLLNRWEQSALLVEANRQYIEALKEKRPATELLQWCEYIQSLHSHIQEVRRTSR